MNASICPLCGGDNRCALVADAGAASSCWCQQARFGPELLARVPQDLLGKSCICAACAAKLPPSPAADDAR